MAFLGSIRRGDDIPINLTVDIAPTGTPTFRIIDPTRTEIVAVTNLDGSGLSWYKTGESVETDATIGEYSIEYTAVLNGVTRYVYDNYEIEAAAASSATPSGDSDWSQTKADIVQQSLELPNIIAVGDSPSSAQDTMVTTVLNQFIKYLQVIHDVKFWKLEWAEHKFSDPDEVTGTDGEVYTCIKSHTSDSTNKPITGDYWTSYWKLRGSTGGVWVDSTSYSSAADFAAASDVIGIQKAFYRKGNTDIPIEVIGHNEYWEIPNKVDFGSPNRIWFDDNTSNIFVSPQVTDVDDTVIHYQKIVRIEDFDADSDSPDFPVHWIEPVVYQVAYRICFYYNVPERKQREIKRLADETLGSILSSTQEYVEYMRISPNRRR
jgi:hypothetical protein